MDWQVWHTLMLCVALIALMVVRRDAGAVAAVLASQFPFWLGVGAWVISAQNVIWVNLGVDLLAAAGFVLAAHMFGKTWLGFLAIVFLVASVWDIFALSPVNVTFYVELHEVLHYIALAVVVWRRPLVQFSHHIRRLVGGRVAGP